MKRRMFVSLVTAVALIASGCSFPEAYPIEKEQNILIAGIDTEGENISLTTLVDSIAPGGKAGEEQITYKLFATTGKTMFEADDNLHKFMERRPSWYHAKYILLGEEAARSGTDRLLSFFSEDDETRILYRVAVVKGMTAKEFLQQANTVNEDLADYLDTLFSAVGQTGKSREIHLINYAVHRQTPWVSVYMPVLELQKNPVHSQSANSGGDSGGGSSSGERKYLTALNGFALFNEDRLAGFMDGDISRGLNIITNDINNSGLSIYDEYGNGVGLELIESHSSIQPCFDPLSATVEVSLQTNLVEYHKVDPLSDSDLKYLERQEGELVCGEISEAIQCMQQLGSDPARIMDAFYHKDPVKWQAIKDNWKDIFKNLKVTVRVESQINHAYEMNAPLSSGGET